MSETTSSYRGHRFPSVIISHAVWLYYCFSLSFQNVEDLLAERGVIVPMRPSASGAGRLAAITLVG